MIINTQYYCRLLENVIPYWKMLALAFLSMTLMALTLSALPALILHLIDNAIVNENKEIMQQIVLAIFVVFVIRGILYFISNHAINLVGSNLATKLSLAIFKKILTLPNHRLSALANRDINDQFIADSNQLSYVFINVTSVLVRDSLTICGLLAWMFYINQELTLLMLLLIALMVVITQLMNGFISHTNLDLRQKTKNVLHNLLEATKNYRLIMLHDSQTHEGDLFANKIHHVQCAYMKQTAARSLSIILTQIFFIIAISTISYLAIQQVYNHEITPGEAGSIILAALMLAIPLQQFLRINKYMQQGQQVYDKIFSLLDQETKTETGTVDIKRAVGKLVFDNVSYYHVSQTEPLLNKIKLTIKPGEVVVFIDASESCKAALTDLILGFCQPNTGHILLDGYDLTSLKSTSLYANIALLPKNVPIIDDTVAANIAYGEMRCANEAQITAAAQTSHAAKFIRELPHGLQTKLGESKIKLTKTQRQHIGIARALLKDAPILIVDATFISSDIKSNDLQEALQKLMQGRSTVMFSQHSLTRNRANRHFTLRNGYLIEIEN
jgi:ATP-binding cassette, subfamily B, bacterial MsbA